MWYVHTKTKCYPKLLFFLLILSLKPSTAIIFERTASRRAGLGVRVHKVRLARHGILDVRSAA